MLQLLDLAKENAALKAELARIRHHAEALQRLVAGRDGVAQRPGVSAPPRPRQMATEEG